MSRYATVAIAIAALLAGGYVVLRVAGPETVVDADEPAAEEPAPVILWPETDEDAPESEPRRPLATDLELEPLPAPGGGDARAALADPPYLDLDLKPRTIARPELETLNLFDPRYNTRGIIQRRWLTRHFGLQGGFGYSLDEETQEHDIAVGVGFVLTY